MMWKTTVFIKNMKVCRNERRFAEYFVQNVGQGVRRGCRLPKDAIVEIEVIALCQ